MRFALLAALLASVASAQPTAYVGGHWFDGERFVARDTTWADGGLFVEGPLDAARVVELGDAFVVPPFGDAHQHMLDGAYSAGFADSLFHDRGIAYVLVITNPASGAVRVRDRFAGPATLDVAYTHGGFTSTGSHPGPLYEGVSRNARFDAAAPRTDSTAWSRLGDAYWFVDAVQDVGPAWERFVRDGPDAVKVYLADVAAGLAADDMRGHGLRPEVLAEVTRRARAAGLPVYAHVDTADDVVRALDAGVDGFAHLPLRRHARDPDGPNTLDTATVARMAASGIRAIPTASLLMQGPPGPAAVLDPTRRDTLQAAIARQAEELRALHAAGVPLALGADRWMRTSVREADYLVAQEIFEPATVLDLWARVTPQTVFPGRAIGELRPGFEASLLALACDPTADWACTARIAHREKQGHDLVAGGVAQAWRDRDVAAFAEALAETDGPLLRGLKAAVDGDLDAADTALRAALAAASDSLRPFVRERLADVAEERLDFAEAVALRSVDDPTAAASVEAGFARFPRPRVRFDGAEATVPFDGLRVPAEVNGVPVRAVVDTGAPGTGLPRGLVERLGLHVDTTARGVSRVPSMGLEFDVYAVRIDSVSVGGATFYGVPATVGWTDDGAGEDDEIFLGANVLRALTAGLRYDYAGGRFGILRDLPATADPPTFLIADGSAPIVAVVIEGQAANAVVDTGNQAPIYLAEGAFDVSGAPVLRTRSGDGWSVDIVAVDLAAPGHPARRHEAYEASFLFSAGDPVTAVLGRPLWADGALTVDFVNRQIRFDLADEHRGTE